MDHSKLELISFQEEDAEDIYLSDDDEGQNFLAAYQSVKNSLQEDPSFGASLPEEVDQFVNQPVLAHKECRIYPKTRSYAIIRFGENLNDKAIAIPAVIYHNDMVLEGDQLVEEISWGLKAYFNCKRASNIPGVNWLATLAWTGNRKPTGTAHLNEDQWRRLSGKYYDLGSVDVSMKRLPLPTIKSIASQLGSEGLSPPSFFDLIKCMNVRNKGTSDQLEVIDPLDEKLLEDVGRELFPIVDLSERTEEVKTVAMKAAGGGAEGTDNCKRASSERQSTRAEEATESTLNESTEKFKITQKLRGTIDKITRSFLWIVPTVAGISDEPMQVFTCNVMGISCNDLTRSSLNKGDTVYFNLVQIQDIKVVLSVWRFNDKDPVIEKEKERAAKYVGRQENDNQKLIFEGPRLSAKERTPAEDMSAIPVDRSLVKFLEPVECPLV